MTEKANEHPELDHEYVNGAIHPVDLFLAPGNRTTTVVYFAETVEMSDKTLCQRHRAELTGFIGEGKAWKLKCEVLPWDARHFGEIRDVAETVASKGWDTYDLVNTRF